MDVSLPLPRSLATRGCANDKRLVELPEHEANSYQGMRAGSRLQTHFTPLDLYASPPEVES